MGANEAHEHKKRCEDLLCCSAPQLLISIMNSNKPWTQSPSLTPRMLSRPGPSTTPHLNHKFSSRTPGLNHHRSHHGCCHVQDRQSTSSQSQMLINNTWTQPQIPGLDLLAVWPVLLLPSVCAASPLPFFPCAPASFLLYLASSDLPLLAAAFL